VQRATRKFSATVVWGPSLARRSDTRTVFECPVGTSERYRPFSDTQKLTLRIRNGSDDRGKGVHDLIDRRVSANVQLGENQVIARNDLIRATLGGNQRDVTDVVLVLAEYCLNHAHGTVGVVSDGRR